MLKKRINENTSTNPNKRAKSDEDQLQSIDAIQSAGTSKYFSSNTTLAEQILKAQDDLNKELRNINFKTRDIKYVYNPLEYAFELNTIYMRKFGNTTKKVLFVGMNPGPFGMCQTGVPFGDPHWVREWLQVEGEVSSPDEQCPERPILGLASTRKEVSGDRLWSFFASVCSKPEVLFRNCFVFNYCPLMFMKAGGNNVTPAEIRDVQVIHSVCLKNHSKSK